MLRVGARLIASAETQLELALAREPIVRADERGEQGARAVLVMTAAAERERAAAGLLRLDAAANAS